MLIDSHCHLDFEVLAQDRATLLQRMADEGIAGAVTISTRVHRFDEIRKIAEENQNIWCSVGTHPHNADEELDISTDDLIRLSAHPKCIAIGEAGLDYHYDKSPRDAQAIGFRRHIDAARQTRLPLVIHARAADQDMASILKDEMANGGFPFILHCFSSGLELAKIGLELGGYLSFSGIVTFKNAQDVQEAARIAPADRILVETDAPYLAPTPFRGKTNEPSYVKHTAMKLAELRGVSFEDVASATTQNFAHLFSKSGLSV